MERIVVFHIVLWTNIPHDHAMPAIKPLCLYPSPCLLLLLPSLAIQPLSIGIRAALLLPGFINHQHMLHPSFVRLLSHLYFLYLTATNGSFTNSSMAVRHRITSITRATEVASATPHRASASLPGNTM